MARPLARFLVVVGTVGIAHASFVGCGGSDESKQVPREGDGGEGGADGGVPITPAGTNTGATGGNAGGPSGGSANSGSANGGSAGEPVTPEAGAGGTPSDLGGESGAGGVALAGAAGDGGSGGEPGACAPTQGSRISIGFDTNNVEWVKTLTWVDSDGATIANVAASGGNSTCSEPSEFFGESYGVPEGATPGIVVAGSRATAVSCGLDVNITSTPPTATRRHRSWATEYHLYEGSKASQMRVTRTLGFNATPPKFSGVGVRPWQPRVGLATYKNVIYPNAAGTAVTKTAAQSCPGDCVIPTGATWNGAWFADLADNGVALIVVRDPSMTAPVSLTINYDSFSNANLSSFVLGAAMDGWKAPVAEVEYLCFADLKSWPQVERDAATLPSWCGP